MHPPVNNRIPLNEPNGDDEYRDCISLCYLLNKFLRIRYPQFTNNETSGTKVVWQPIVFNQSIVEISSEDSLIDIMLYFVFACFKQLL